MGKGDGAIQIMMSNDMVVKLNMGTLMENIIIKDVDGTLIVT